MKLLAIRVVSKDSIENVRVKTIKHDYTSIEEIMKPI